MRPLTQEIPTAHTPESLVESLPGEAGIVLLRTTQFDLPSARYSFVAANPFLTFHACGSRCEVTHHASRITHDHFGNPWHLLDALMARFELLDEIDSPFPLGGAFGYFGYDLKNFTEPKLPRRAVNDLELPDCHVGFYDSLVVFDHRLGKTCVVSTGLQADGSRNQERGDDRARFWRTHLEIEPNQSLAPALFLSKREMENRPPDSGESKRGNAGGTLENSNGRTTVPPLLGGEGRDEGEGRTQTQPIRSNLSRAEFLAAVERAQRYIRA